MKLLKGTLCVIQLFCLYMVVMHEKYYLVPIQAVIALVEMFI